MKTDVSMAVSLFRLKVGKAISEFLVSVAIKR
jgi:hypothetical protein